MEELIAQIAKNAGITTDQAKIALDTALEYVKGKLPAPFASQIEGLLQGGDLDLPQGLGGLTKGLGGLFGAR